MIHNKQELLSLLRSHQEEIRGFGVKRLGLFGSFFRGTPSPESDVDLIVEFERGEKTFDHFIELSFLLEELFKRPVELVTPESMSPYLKPHITKNVEYVPFGS